MIRGIGFSTFSAIGIEGYPREVEGKENIAGYARRLYEEGRLKDAIDHLYWMKRLDNVKV